MGLSSHRERDRGQFWNDRVMPKTKISYRLIAETSKGDQRSRGHCGCCITTIGAEPRRSGRKYGRERLGAYARALTVAVITGRHRWRVGRSLASLAKHESKHWNAQ